VVWGWLWWRTRSLRKRGNVIEGEYRDETPKPLLPERDRRL
jgi:hypothetical protein